MEPVSPPASSLVHQYDEEFTKLSISELISILRTAFQTDEYDRVEEALISKELKLKREIEDKTKKIKSLNSKAEIAVLDKMSIEEEMQKQKEQLKKQLKEGKAAEERFDTLMKKFMDNGPEDTSVVDELRTKICKLEDEKQTAESMIVHWKMKVGDLTKRVSRLENEIKSLMNGDCSNVGVNTERDSRADTTTKIVEGEKETLSPSHRIGSAHFPSGTIIIHLC